LPFRMMALYSLANQGTFPAPHSQLEKKSAIRTFKDELSKKG
jgi:hypothetical protein